MPSIRSAGDPPAATCAESWRRGLWNGVAIRIAAIISARPPITLAPTGPVYAPSAPRLGSSQLGSGVRAWSLVQADALFRPQTAMARDLAALGLRVPPLTLEYSDRMD